MSIQNLGSDSREHVAQGFRGAWGGIALPGLCALVLFSLCGAARTLRVLDGPLATSAPGVRSVPLELPRELHFEQLISKPKLNSEEWAPRPGAGLDARVLDWVDAQQKRWRPHQAETAEWRHPSGRNWKPSMYRGHMWRTILPGGQELYMLEMRPILMHVLSYWLFLRDPGSRALSLEPAILNGRWMPEAQGGDVPRVAPRVYLQDLMGDGSPEILFTSRGHNGTVYSADQQHYLEPAPDLSLVPVLTLDVRQTDSSASGSGKGWILRDLVRISSSRLRVKIWREDWGVTTGRIPIGTLDLERRGSPPVWGQVGRNVLDKEHAWAVVHPIQHRR